VEEREVRQDADGLTLRGEARNGTAALAVAGELDLATVPALKDALAQLEGTPALELDLSGVSFMDSSGLRALLTARRDAQAAGRRLRLVAVPPAVSRVLELTRTAALFDLG
jgi:anti-sigma B factor antagonist